MVAYLAVPSVRQIGRLACVLVIGLGALVAAKTQPGNAQPATTAKRFAWAPDTYCLCSDKIPNISAIPSCMVAKASRRCPAFRAVC